MIIAHGKISLQTPLKVCLFNIAGCISIYALTYYIMQDYVRMFLPHLKKNSGITLYHKHWATLLLLNVVYLKWNYLIFLLQIERLVLVV